ncbi:MAG: methyltransferase domain-containing protein [Alphaproteobacteria bacterium]|nr:methyltransferase domain-containing protein [Alphaproteobacteria bacterium]
MNAPAVVFDRPAVRRARARAAARFAAFDFLHRAGAERLADRLDVMTRRFPLALELGARGPLLREAVAGLDRIGTLVTTDPAAACVAAAPAPRLVADEEWLPFAPATFDLAISNLALHWVNDLPGALVQIRDCLKPDGLLLVSLLGGRTLAELRDCLVSAEIEVSGGARPRISPFVDVRGAGALLQRAGFAMPVVDADALTVTYADAFALMRDLRGMGETNALATRCRHFSRRDVLLRAAGTYAERHAGADGRIVATFEIVTLTAWSPGPAQPRALRPGSATMRLADALGSVEIPAGDRARGKPS